MNRIIRRVTMSGRSVSAVFAVLLLSAFTVQAEGLDEVREFNIEAQALDAALIEFSEQAGLQLMVPTELVAGLESPGINGEVSATSALASLLDDNELTFQAIGDDTVALSRADEDKAPGKSRPASSLVLMAQNRTSVERERRSRTASENDEDEVPQLEEIVVTGSRIRGAQNASPVVTITRQEIDQAGFATVEDIIENLPQNFGAGATSDAINADNINQTVGGSVGGFAGGTSVNLRGLGADSTLVLLNGRRMSPSGNVASFTNIASIPVTAIERVEMMTDGASAIYGSDAIGGVINFIMRESYDGAETRLRYGSDAGGDTSSVQFGQSFGTSWDSGNVLLTYEYYDSGALASRDRKFTASNDLSPFGGTDWRQPGGNPANIRTGPFPWVFYAIPTGQDGTALTSADFVGLENTQHLNNAREFQDVTPDEERHSAFFHLRQSVGAVELVSAARFSSEKNTTRLAQQSVDFFSVTDASPFFVDPTGTGLTTVRVDNYRLEDDFGPLMSFGEVESAGATLGARVEFSDNWRGELAINWSEEEAPRAIGNVVDTAALRAAANLADPGLAFNPFGDGSNTNPAVIESLVDRRRVPNTRSKNELRSASFDINGDAFEMSGGVLKVAAGTDFREESLSNENFSSGATANLKRDILAVYAEVFLPLVSDANRRMGLQRFEVSLAARYEDYSDFGDNTSPKLGILWSPTESLNLRGTWGTSYRAPSLTDLDETIRTSWFYIQDGLGGAYPFLLKDGNNSGLQPQEATTWTAGFQWSPESVEGLSLDITYFNVDYTGRIERPTLSPQAATFDPRFDPIITLTPTQEQIAAFVNDPLYRPDALIGFGLGPYPAADFLGAMPLLPVGAIIDNRLTNLAQSVVTGTELQLSYTAETDLGSYNVGLNGSYLFDFERKFFAADPLIDEVDTFGRPVDFRARGNVTWSREGWSVTGFINYTDGYTDQLSSPEQSVDSWTTVDLTIAYETGNDAGFLSDTRLSLTTQNLFDEDPPFVNTVGGVAYDATNANPLGQFFSLQITKNWSPE